MRAHHPQYLRNRYLTQRLPAALSLSYGDGRVVPIKRFLRTHVESATHGPTVQLPLFIVSMPTHLPVILGMDSLRATRPDIDWDDGRLLYRLVPTDEFDHPPTPEEVAIRDDIQHIMRNAAARGLPAFDADDFDALTTRTAPAMAQTQSSPASVTLASLSVDTALSPVSPHKSSQARALATPPGVSQFCDPDEDPDEIALIKRVVPAVYHDLLDVFSKVNADKLPELRFLQSIRPLRTKRKSSNRRLTLSWLKVSFAQAALLSLQVLSSTRRKRAHCACALTIDS